MSWSRKKLERSKSESPRWDVEFILSSVLQKETSFLYAHPEEVLEATQQKKFEGFICRRVEGEPVAYILESKDFFKLNFFVDPRVLIPRPESELLVEQSLIWLQASGEEQPKQFESNLNIVEFGVGSGAIGLSIVHEILNSKWGSQWTEIKLIAIDFSGPALEVAKINAERIGVSKSVYFSQENLDIEDNDKVSILEELVSKVDIVVMNPPYISRHDPALQANVKKFEPAVALFSDEDGFYSVRRWTIKAKKYLKSRGAIFCEIGCGQGALAAKEYSEVQNFASVRVIKDLAGLDRVVCGVKV